MSLMTWLKSIFCKENVELEQELSNKTASLIKCEQNSEEYLNTITAKESEVAQLKDDLKDLEESKDLIPSEIINKAEELKNSYPSANIVYKGYTIKLKSSTRVPEIRVQDFIQVINSHKDWIRTTGLSLDKYRELYPDMSFGDLINKLMFDIYKKYAPRKSYVTDNILYGVDEQWAPALDTWYLRQMDCENSTNELMCLFEASGLTSELRSFYWNVCGDTSVGGHSTLYAYDFKNDTWRHFETTATSVPYADFYSLPDNHDNTDELNITSVWWSFNSDIARHIFKTDADKKAYIKRKRFKNIIIKK
jgi:hypothetical protein